MDPWFNVIAAGSEFSADSVKELDEVGFVVIRGPVAPALRRESSAFVPRSQRWGHAPSDVMQDASEDYEGQVSACGAAGSVVIYNGLRVARTWANQTHEPRRCIQGAYIRRDDKQGTNQAARMRPETLARIGALAKYVLNVESQLSAPDA
jgi:hypothetical protein